MRNNKLLGLKRIPTEYYKNFWPNIGQILIHSFNESLDELTLSDSQRCAILSLIFKKVDNSY